jgi:hypothetical protein
MGQAAARLLAALIAGESGVNTRQIVSCRAITGETVGPPSRSKNS